MSDRRLLVAVWLSVVLQALILLAIVQVWTRVDGVASEVGNVCDAVENLETQIRGTPSMFGSSTCIVFRSGQPPRLQTFPPIP